MASSSQAGAPARSQWSKIVSASQRALEVGSGFLAEASIVVTHGDAHLENIHEGASRLAKIGAGVTRQLDALADLEVHLTTRQQNNERTILELSRGDVRGKLRDIFNELQAAAVAQELVGGDVGKNLYDFVDAAAVADLESRCQTLLQELRHMSDLSDKSLLSVTSSLRAFREETSRQDKSPLGRAGKADSETEMDNRDGAAVLSGSDDAAVIGEPQPRVSSSPVPRRSASSPSLASMGQQPWINVGGAGGAASAVVGREEGGGGHGGGEGEAKG